jgi:GrpB-like predicted nucleotidyltransferase (UPF0157 family)
MRGSEGHSDALERKLDAILIGHRQPGPVTLSEYDPSWPARFEALREELSAGLGPLAASIEHIGSTAGPGLAAKPIVDVLVTVQRIEPDDEYLAALEVAGYTLRVREPGHRMFRSPARDVHVHFWARSSTEAEDYLLLRDRLRCSARDRDEYERLKRELAPRAWPDVNYYAEAKGPLITELLARERAER